MSATLARERFRVEPAAPWGGREKEIARRDHTGRKDRKYRHILTLPGDGCRCVRQFLASGMIDEDTEITAVEENRVVAEKIKRQLARLGLRDFRVVEERLQEFSPPSGERYDFVNLDLCQQLQVDTLDWLESRCPFRHKADLCLNVYAAPRHPRNRALYARLSSLARGGDYVVTEAIQSRFRLTGPGFGLPQVLAVAAILALHAYEFDLAPPYPYMDGSPMCLLNVFDVRRAKMSYWPSHRHFLSNIPPCPVPATAC